MLVKFIKLSPQVSNAEKYKYFERWATANGLPRDCVVNDGSTAGTVSLARSLMFYF